MDIYLDDAATSKVDSRTADVVHTYMTSYFGNPSASYHISSRPFDAIHQTRKLIKEMLHAFDNDLVVFTSGGSESNSWAIQGWAKEMYCSDDTYPITVITSCIEHVSVLECVKDIRRCGMIDTDPYLISVDQDGFVNLDELEQVLMRLGCCHKLVSIQFANNEIGTIQHIKDIANLVHRYDGIFHTDAVQAFGHIPIDVQELGIDLLSASGHKIGAPKGVGFLYIRHGVKITPLIYGKQNDGLRGGTENVPGIVGLYTAAKQCIADQDYVIRMTILRNNFLSMLKPLKIMINGSLEERLPNNLNITFVDDVYAESMVYMLDCCGVYIGTGSACNSHSISTSHVLRAIGLCDLDAMKTIRLTLPRDITMEELETVAKLIDQQKTLAMMDI